ncbi:MAG: hypothetical protein KF745_12125 [Phycisphaeraceae bacterium]|nr:hypothetical protein [Phycisphaeraceae bacterium]
MDWTIVIGVIVAVLLIGSGMAVLWWKIAARMAPYKDESPARGRKTAAGSGDEEVVVIRRSGDAAPHEKGP